MENNEDILEELIEYDKNATATIPQNLGFTISIYIFCVFQIFFHLFFKHLKEVSLKKGK